MLYKNKGRLYISAVRQESTCVRSMKKDLSLWAEPKAFHGAGAESERL